MLPLQLSNLFNLPPDIFLHRSINYVFLVINLVLQFLDGVIIEDKMPELLPQSLFPGLLNLILIDYLIGKDSLLEQLHHPQFVFFKGVTQKRFALISQHL